MILEIKILLVSKRTIKILQYLMFSILHRKISVFRRNAPINTKRFIQDRDIPISLRVIEVINASLALHHNVNHQYSVPTIYQRVSRTSILNKVLIF